MQVLVVNILDGIDFGASNDLHASFIIAFRQQSQLIIVHQETSWLFTDTTKDHLERLHSILIGQNFTHTSVFLYKQTFNTRANNYLSMGLLNYQRFVLQV